MTTIHRTVRYAEFAQLMRMRGIDHQYLVKRFRGEFGDGTGDVRAFFEQVFHPCFRKRLIPYRSVIDFYLRETGAIPDTSGRERRCACGCGQRVFGKKKWASDACKQRGYRHRVADDVNRRR